MVWSQEIVKFQSYLDNLPALQTWVIILRFIPLLYTVEIPSESQECSQQWLAHFLVHNLSSGLAVPFVSNLYLFFLLFLIITKQPPQPMPEKMQGKINRESFKANYSSRGRLGDQLEKKKFRWKCILCRINRNLEALILNSQNP